MRRIFALIVIGLLLFAGAASAGTPLESVYTYDGAPVLGEHVDGEILVMLEIPAAAATAEGAAYGRR